MATDISRGEAILIFIVAFGVIFGFTFAIYWNWYAPNQAVLDDLEVARNRTSDNDNETLPGAPLALADNRVRQHHTILERHLMRYGRSPTSCIQHDDDTWTPMIIRGALSRRRRVMFDVGPQERYSILPNRGGQSEGSATASDLSHAETATAGRSPGCILVTNSDGEQVVLEDGRPILPPTYRPRAPSQPLYRYSDPDGLPSYQAVVQLGRSPPSEVGPSTCSRPRPCPPRATRSHGPRPRSRGGRRLQPTVVRAPPDEDAQTTDDSDGSQELVMRWSRREDWELALARGREPNPDSG